MEGHAVQLEMKSYPENYNYTSVTGMIAQPVN